MQLINGPTNRAELISYAAASYGRLVKAVVDIEREVIAIDAGMHADLEQYLLDGGSMQSDLWGINLYPNAQPESFLEFDSMINLRPPDGNFSRGVDSPETQSRIRQLVERLFPI